MTNSRKMMCPNCGAEMNHHCDKVAYTTDLQHGGHMDLGLGGFIEEFHTCPKCGSGAARPA